MKKNKNVVFTIINSCKKIADKIDENILKIEMIMIITCVFVSMVLEIYVATNDCPAWLQWSMGIYLWIQSTELINFLILIDGFAIVVGGISFFLKKWIEKDTGNIVFLLVVVFSLLLSHVFKITGLHIMSFAISLVSGILLFIPFLSLACDCYVGSKRVNLKINDLKIEIGDKNGNNKR